MHISEILSDLEKAKGGATEAARAVGVKPTTWSNWKGRKLPEDAHLRVWLALNSPNLLRRWLKEKDAA